MVARTLTQHAVPTTFGLKAAQWLAGVLDAYDDLAGLVFPVQIGGAAGTHAAVVELGGSPQELVVQVAPAPRPRAGRALAHPSHRRHPARRRAGPLHRRVGPDRRGRADPEPPRDRRAQRGHRRRVVDDAAQAQPGPVGAGPPRRHDHPDARRDPAPGRRPAGRRARRRRLARRVGDPARPGPPHAGRRLADLRPGRRPRGRPRPDGRDPARRPRAGRRRAVVDGRAGRARRRPSPTSASPPSSSTRSSSAPG